VKERLLSVPEELLPFHAELINQGHLLSFREDRSHLNDVLKQIYKGGLTVEAIDVKKTTLEDVFIALTHKRS